MSRGLLVGRGREVYEWVTWNHLTTVDTRYLRRLAEAVDNTKGDKGTMQHAYRVWARPDMLHLGYIL